jgi:hypothetical protein
MPTQTGTATDYLDLLVQFNTFVAGLSGGMAWTALRSAAPEYIWQAPGSLGSPADPLIVGVKPFFNAGADYYNWRLGGFVAFDASLAFEAQSGYVGASGVNCPVLNLWNSSMAYRFYATGRRAIILAKVSTVYVVAYLGYLSSYMAPGAFPYPLIVGGSMAWDGAEPAATSANWRWSYNGAEMANFPTPQTPANPFGSSLRMRRPDGVWVGFGKAAALLISNPNIGKVWPYGNWGTNQTADMRTNLDGGYMLLPVILQDVAPNNYGELDGIYALSGFSNSAENTVTIGGVVHYVVPNVFRTTQRDFFAIKEA